MFRMMRFSIALVAVVVALGVSGADARRDTGLKHDVAASTATDDKAAAVEAVFAGFVKPGEPGGSVIVVKDGKEIYKGAFGVGDIDHQTPLTPHSMFHLASAGKQFTALGIMMLAEEGKLHYDDAIGMYLPELQHFGDHMTIRTLMTHTSGIADPYSGALEDLLLARNPAPTNADTLAILADALAAAAPGDKYDYSNSGYDMLATLIEHLSGEAFPAFLQERIFGPTGMTSTFSMPAPRRQTDPNIVHSYTLNDGKVEALDVHKLDNTVGSGSAYTTVEDMARYDNALNAGKFVKASTLAEAFKPMKLNNGTVSQYGFGWEFDAYNGVKYIGHDGSWLGFRTVYLKFPSQKLTVVVLLNRDYGIPEDDVYDVGKAVAGIFLED
jgi:CubicO group peptidase (beta-lactamase class C family)